MYYCPNGMLLPQRRVSGKIKGLEGALAMAKISDRCRQYIKRKIKLLLKEGRPQKQAVAAAYNMARDRGCEIPAAKRTGKQR